jgi:hypothetical protein
MNESLLQTIREKITRGALVVFLGFGFHEQNVTLLSALDRNDARVLGTVLGIPHPNHVALKRHLQRVLRADSAPELYELEAGQFMKQLRPSILLASA